MLWRQGERRASMVFVVDGGLAASLHVPGDREVEIARAGPGEMLGELALLDGGGHTMACGRPSRRTVLVLSRTDFAALARPPRAVGVRAQAPARVTVRRAAIATSSCISPRSLGGDWGAAARRRSSAPSPISSTAGRPTASTCGGMATFHDFDSLALWGFLTSGKYVRCPPGRTLLAEGAPSKACYLTINGAVEKVLIRGDRRIRVGLAGPGQGVRVREPDRRPPVAR